MRFTFLAGLPRSGSTLLSALLNQRPDIHVSTNSPSAAVMWRLEAELSGSQQYRANPKPKALYDLVAGVLPTLYADRTEDVVMDKSRVWGTPGNLRMLRTYVTAEPRIVYLTRPVVEVLASLMALIHANPPGSIYDQGLPDSFRPVDDVRCDAMMAPGGDIDRALWSVHNLGLEENEGVGHEVTYSGLMADTRGTLAGIEQFLSLAPFAYDLTHIEPPEAEDDSVYGLAGMHDVRQSISPSTTRPGDVLSDYVLNKYGDL